MAGFGFTVSEISELTGLSNLTLWRRYRKEWRTAALERDLEVVERVFARVGVPPETSNKATRL
jgi:hypothetical protein